MARMPRRSLPRCAGGQASTQLPNVVLRRERGGAPQDWTPDLVATARSSWIFTRQNAQEFVDRRQFAVGHVPEYWPRHHLQQIVLIRRHVRRAKFQVLARADGFDEPFESQPGGTTRPIRCEIARQEKGPNNGLPPMR